MNRKQALSLDVPAAKTADLLAAYNTLTGKNVARFSDRAAAERRTAAAIAAAQHANKADALKHGRCPFCDADPSCITAAGEEGTPAGDRNFCHSCGVEFHQDGREHKAFKASVLRSASIAASWKDQEVAAARATRHGVKVRDNQAGTTEVYRSVRAAFQALGLPLGRHIRFRGDLKAAGKLAWGDRYVFTIVEQQ